MGRTYDLALERMVTADFVNVTTQTVASRKGEKMREKKIPRNCWMDYSNLLL